MAYSKKSPWVVLKAESIDYEESVVGDRHWRQPVWELNSYHDTEDEADIQAENLIQYPHIYAVKVEEIP